ncbi:MAG: DNA-binding protein [Actinomycetia bacterium]|nr:DNA-binding protein [Actinomycetes bacterium]
MANYKTYGLRVAGEDFTCIACKHGKRFIQREIKLNTTGMSFMGLDWLNEAADGAVCERCGYVHSFLGNNHQWV